MWAITIIIEAYEGFHSSRLNMELEELEDRELGKIVFLKVFEKRSSWVCHGEISKVLTTDGITIAIPTNLYLLQIYKTLDVTLL